MLAYVFWHRPRANVERALYEESLRHFHRSLEAPSACFRVVELPFARMEGYEDWYLVEDWQALGALNQLAVDARHCAVHDAVARLTGDSWGGIYQLLRGAAEVPASTLWLVKPRDRSYADFLASLSGSAVWRRQMVLGPAPEFCVANGPVGGRTRL